MSTQKPKMSGEEFVNLWMKLADQGSLNRNTALAFQTACRHILGQKTGWEKQDIAAMDPAQVEDLLRRFTQKAKAKGFQEKTLAEYKRRFRQAIQWLHEYLKNPRGWKPQVAPRAVAPQRRKEAPAAAASTVRKPTPPPAARVAPTPKAAVAAAATEPAPAETPAACVEYPFPLRPGLVARLVLPADLSPAEVKRLAGFLETLVLPRGGAEG